MTYIKILFLLIMAMLERCHVLKKEVVHVRRSTIDSSLVRSEKDFTGSWRVMNVSNSPSAINPPGKMKDPESGVIFSFFHDSTFTEIHSDGYYTHGTYKLVLPDSILHLETDGRIENIKLSFATIANLRRVMKLNTVIGTKTLAEYAYPLKSEKEDPFHPDNNEWRRKPLVAQNQDQINDKLRNYIKHNCTILKAAQDRNQDMVSWEFSDGILKIYNGGIGIVPEQGIPKSWSDVFHNQSDAKESYKLFAGYLRASNYKGPLTGNWVQDDYHILLAIYAASQNHTSLK